MLHPSFQLGHNPRLGGSRWACVLVRHKVFGFVYNGEISKPNMLVPTCRLNCSMVRNEECRAMVIKRWWFTCHLLSCKGRTHVVFPRPELRVMLASTLIDKATSN